MDEAAFGKLEHTWVNIFYVLGQLGALHDWHVIVCNNKFEWKCVGLLESSEPVVFFVNLGKFLGELFKPLDVAVEAYLAIACWDATEAKGLKDLLVCKQLEGVVFNNEKLTQLRVVI